MAATPGCRHPAEWSVLLTISEYLATTYRHLGSSHSPNDNRSHLLNDGVDPGGLGSVSDTDPDTEIVKVRPPPWPGATSVSGFRPSAERRQ